MPRNKYKKSNRSTLGSHIVEGVEYPNLPSISEEYEISLNTIYKRYSRGHRGDGLVPKKKHKNYVPPKKEINYKFYVNGIGYKSYQDACRKNNINYITFRKRYFVYGWSLARALNTPPLWYRDGSSTFSARKIEVENKEFESIAAAARHYGLTPDNVVTDLKKGLTVNQALKLEIRPTENLIKFKGTFYESKNDLCKKLKFPYSTLLNRIRKGLTIEEAIDLGPDHLLSEGRYNEKILKRNPALAAKSAKLYFAIVIINENKRYKIGITTQKVSSRLSAEFNSYKILKLIKQSLLECYLLEKKLLNTFSEYRDRNITSEQMDGYTEVFDFPENVVENIKSILDDNLKIV